jgi:hypothetical protein
MTEIAKKIAEILDNKLVSFVSIMDLDAALRRSGEAKQFSTFGPIEHKIHDAEIIFTMEHDVPEKETLVIPLADDMIIKTTACGKQLGLPDDEEVYSLKLLSNTLRIVAGINYVDKAV